MAAPLGRLLLPPDFEQVFMALVLAHCSWYREGRLDEDLLRYSISFSFSLFSRCVPGQSIA
jgi:hypothetical protein